MSRHRIRVALATLSAVTLLVVGFSATASAGGRPLVAHLSGNAVSNGASLDQGDRDGRGLAVVKRTSTDGSLDEVCWLVVTGGVALPARAGGIYAGGSSAAAGTPIVDFAGANAKTYPHALPSSVVHPGAPGRGVGLARGCVQVPDATADAIWAHPSGYFVQVDGASPANAAVSLSRSVRGQLR